MRLFCLFVSIISSPLIAPPVYADTLQEAIARALATNPAIDIQQEAVNIADAQIDTAKAARRPQVTVSASAGLQRRETNQPFQPNFGTVEVGQLQLDAAIPLYTGGRIGASIRQSETGKRLSQTQLSAARQDIILETASSYVNVLHDRRARDIRQNSVNLLSRQLAAARDRFDVGVVTRTDVAQAEARLEGARAGLAGSVAMLQASEAGYRLVTGEMPAELVPVTPLPPLPTSFEAALSEALETNPEIITLTQNEQISEDAIEIARSALRPQVSLTASALRQDVFTESLRDETLSAFANVTIPLFEGDLLRSQIRAARFTKEQNRLRIDLARRELRARLAGAWYQHLAALSAIEATKRQVQAARIAYNGAQEELSVGVRTTLDVLDQEQQLLEARLALQSAERDAFISAVQIIRLIGDLQPTVFNLN